MATFQPARAKRRARALPRPLAPPVMAMRWLGKRFMVSSYCFCFTPLSQLGRGVGGEGWSSHARPNPQSCTSTRALSLCPSPQRERELSEPGPNPQSCTSTRALSLCPSPQRERELSEPGPGPQSCTNTRALSLYPSPQEGEGNNGQPFFNFSYFFNSSLAINPRCTSSGPSAIRSTRA